MEWLDGCLREVHRADQRNLVPLGIGQVDQPSWNCSMCLVHREWFWDDSLHHLVWGKAMFAGQLSGSILIGEMWALLQWLQKGGKTVWILGEQQYYGNVVPFCKVRTLSWLSSVGAHGAGTQS